MAINKTDKNFKTLINKRFTTPDREFFQEIGKDTINMSKREVWLSDLSEQSASMIASGTVELRNKFRLTADPTFASQSFYFISGSGFSEGTDVINSGWLINEDSQSYFQSNFVPDKFGAGYEVELYDNTNQQIFKTDPISWIFDYKTGVLHVADIDQGSYETPFKVTVYQYKGRTLADIFTDDTFNFSGSMIITGSIDVSGSITATNISATSSHAISASYAVTASFAQTVAPGIGGLWTGSEDGSYISRQGNVKVSGSMFYRQGDRIIFGDGDTYIHEPEPAEDSINFVFPAGTALINGYQISFTGFNSPGFGNVTATDTVPNVVPRTADPNTGLGHAADDILSLIAGGANILNVVYASNTGSVGIGTTAPVSVVGIGGLHVWQNISSSDYYGRNIYAQEISASTYYGDGSQLSGIATSSLAVTASYAHFATSASHADLADSASSAVWSATALSASHAAKTDLSDSASSAVWSAAALSASFAEQSDSSLTASSALWSVTASFAQTVAPGIGRLWTGSDGGSISRLSNVNITGSLGVSSDVIIPTKIIIGNSVNEGYSGVGDIYGRINILPSHPQVWFYNDIGNQIYGRLRWVDTDDYFSIAVRNDGTDAIVAFEDGGSGVLKVGIGTTQPTSIGTSSLHVWGNISASNLYWDNTDISSFSSSISAEFTALTSSYWTGSVGGAISRLSDIQITGDVDINGGLNIDQSQWGDAISIDVDRYINFNGGSSFGWALTQISSPANTLVFEYNESGNNNIGYFVLSRGTGDKTNVIIYSGSLVVNKDQTDYNPSSSFEVYGSSYMGGNIAVPSLATVDGVDISEFSSSVASDLVILNTITGSFWTGSIGSSISRQSDVNITGSLGVSNTITALTASIGNIATGLFQINPSVTYVARAYSSQNPFVLEALQEGTIFSPSTISRPAFRAFRSNTSGDVSTYSDAVSVIRNSDDATMSDNFKIQSGNSPVTRFLVDYWGNTFVSGNISLSTGSTVDGVDIDVFSASVAQDLTNIATGSGYWSLKGDGSISRNSDIRVTGSIFGLDTATNTLRVGNATRYLNFHNTTNDPEFGLSPVLSIHNSANYLKLTTGALSWVYSTTPLKIASSQSIELEPDIIGGTTGSVNVIGNLYVENAFQVTGSINALTSGSFGYLETDTDIKIYGTLFTEYSASVAQQITNIETGSSIWSLEQDGTISRNSDVRISGSLYLSGSDNRFYGTASWAESASSALWTISSSFAESTPTASFSTWAISSSFAESTPTASFSTWAISSSFAESSLSSSSAVWSATALTSSHALTSLTASFAQTIAPGIGGLWTGSDGGSISRLGDVDVNGILTANSGTFGDSNTGIVTLAWSPNLILGVSSVLNHKLAYFQQLTDIILSPSTITNPTVGILRNNSSGYVSSYTDAVFRLENRDDTSISDNVIIQSGDSLVDRFTIDYYGNTFVSGNISLSTGSTVDGVDISEFSSSVEERITNAESGSSKWALLDDGSISRASNVHVTGSLGVSVSGSFDYFSTEFVHIDCGTF